MKKTIYSVAAFSLVELLFSIVVITILSAIVVATIINARNSAESVQCVSNLRTLSNGFQLYAMSHGGNVPQEARTWPNWIHQLMPEAILGEEGYRRYYPSGGPIPILKCPQSTANFTLYWHSDYGVNTNILSMKIAGTEDEYTETKPYEQYQQQGRIILAVDSYGKNDKNAGGRMMSREQFADAVSSGRAGEILRHNGKSNAVFLDGHVERLGRDEMLERRRWAE